MKINPYEASEIPDIITRLQAQAKNKHISKEAVRKRNGAQKQMSLFEYTKENPPLCEAIEFYKHRHNWSNRMIAGDSLLVMNSLIEKEGMAGKVQMIYMDPPYGIRYGSNFQPFVNKREVKDGWSRLVKNLKAEVDDRGIESLKIVEVK